MEDTAHNSTPNKVNKPPPKSFFRPKRSPSVQSHSAPSSRDRPALEDETNVAGRRRNPPGRDAFSDMQGPRTQLDSVLPTGSAFTRQPEPLATHALTAIGSSWFRGAATSNFGSSRRDSSIPPRRMAEPVSERYSVVQGRGSIYGLADALPQMCTDMQGDSAPVLPVVNVLFPMFAGRRPMVSGSGTRVELHAHLEGSVRYETIWETMKAKKIELPGDGSLRAMKEVIIAKFPTNMPNYGEPIPQYMQAFANDTKAVERIAYEFCEDKVEQGVLYVEARYAPHMMLPLKISRSRILHGLCEIVSAVNRGFKIAEMEFGITVRTILVIVVGLGNAKDVLSLCQQFRDKGVVGIDMMLPYERFQDQRLWASDLEEVPLSQEELQVFQSAAQQGINRTVHAGHIGSAYMVQRAVDKFRAQRLGHGYEVLKLPSLYGKCRERNLHFECCPWESLLSGAVDPGTIKHPITQFAEDGINFSLNTSDPTITGVTLQEEYDLVNSWGLTEAHIVRANINALRSSFLPADEKAQLMQTLLENIGIRKRNM